MAELWVTVARALIVVGVAVMLVVHMGILLSTGLRSGFYSPEAVDVVQRLAVAVLFVAVLFAAVVIHLGRETR